jgi:hypothetical protein
MRRVYALVTAGKPSLCPESAVVKANRVLVVKRGNEVRPDRLLFDGRSTVKPTPRFP